MAMIDWITCCIRWPHSKPFNNGNIISINSDGEQEWDTEKWLPVRGSYDSSIQICSRHIDAPCSHILLSGNPTKFLQGHNIWGSDDLSGLIGDTFFKVLSLVGFDGRLPKYPMGAIAGAHITRVDINSMYHLKNGSEVNSWLRSAEFSATTRHTGRGQIWYSPLSRPKNHEIKIDFG